MIKIIIESVLLFLVAIMTIDYINGLVAAVSATWLTKNTRLKGWILALLIAGFYCLYNW